MSADDVHVYPRNDLLAHEVDGDDCPCLPHTVPNEHDGRVVGFVVIHNAWDGRE